ncbi:MAG: spore germination protein [Firmicutes bacterium]|nr:spore germination protein [Bacillota bacterium]
MQEKSLDETVAELQKLFSNSPDLVVRKLKVGTKKAAVAFFASATDIGQLSLGVISPLIDYKLEAEPTIELLANEIVKSANASKIGNKDEYIQNLLSGQPVLFLDGSSQVLQFRIDQFAGRMPAEPPTSTVINGPREGFVETLEINISLIRKRLRTPDLAIKSFKVGKYTATRVCLCYINSIADKKIVKKLEQKIQEIDIDGVLDSFYIESFLENHTHTMFKQFGYAEKPDIVVGKMLEGRIAILVDGSPIALTVPFVLMEDFQNSNDYYQKSARGTFLRWLRLFSTIVAVLLPGTYIAVVLYHYKILPVKFLITIVNTTQGIPFSPFLEMLFIIMLFEILYEASLRMPRYLGMALAIVGALILGDTAVRAGLVTPPAIMIAALTGVMLYTMPDQQHLLSLLRIMFAVIGGLLGLYGIVIGAIFLIAYMANMDSYGAPYLGPFSPRIKSDLKDALTNSPLTDKKTRPRVIPNSNHRRQKQ